MSVTVPGANGPVTLSGGGNDAFDLSGIISRTLAAISTAGNLAVTNASASGNIPAPNNAPGSTAELVLSGSGAATIAPGYNYVVLNGSTPLTVTGSGGQFLGGDLGNTFFVSGQSTVAAIGGDNAVSAGGSYLISTGAGNDTVFASGSGTVAPGAGTNTVVLSADMAGAGNFVRSIGTDLIVAAAGNNTVASSGDRTGILGSGTGALVVSISGANDTIAAGAGPTTINASGSVLVFGGAGPLQFVGGGTPTLVGAPGGTETVSSSGGMLFASGANNTALLQGGVGTSTIFGAPGSVLNYSGSQGGALAVAGSGNETLSAANSSSGNFFAGATDPAAGSVLIGGSGTDTLLAGAGAVTLAGGAGPDAFVFFKGATAGAQDFIADFDSSDSVYILGYDPAQSASSLVNNAVTTANGPTLTLSDNTQITFTGLSSTTQLYGKILYG